VVFGFFRSYNRRIAKVENMSHYIEVVERYLVPDLPPTDLPYEDGVPLETNWHRLQINLLADNIRQLWPGRSDYFAGGNMFVYYSMGQVRNRDYKGPDFFVVKGVDGLKDRKSWIAWDEDGRLPNVIVELLSPTTAKADLGKKKDLYEGTFKTAEYFCLDPDDGVLRGWRLLDMKYKPIETGAEGRLWSKELDARSAATATTWCRWCATRRLAACRCPSASSSACSPRSSSTP
jgi:Uma2 family endonuclease